MQLSGILHYFNNECLLAVRTIDPYHPTREIHLAYDDGHFGNELQAAAQLFQTNHIGNNQPVTISGDYRLIAGTVTAFFVTSIP
jgi:hypothetical protein